MVIHSPLPKLDIPRTNVLDYVFAEPENEAKSGGEKRIWIDLEDPAHAMSRNEAKSWVKRLGKYLQSQGIKKDDVCLTLSENHIFMPVAFYAIVGCGAAFSGLNPDYTVQELVYQIKKTRAKLILVHPDFLSKAIPAARQAGLPQSSLVLFSDRKGPPDVHGIPDWRTVVPSSAEHWQWQQLSAAESMTTVAVINFSSGTTGLPKGVCVSHFNLIANVEQTHAVFKFSSQERWLAFLPMFHAYGQIYTFIFAPRLKISTYIMRRFKFTQYLEAVQTHRITRLHSVPPVLTMLEKRPETMEYDLSSVKDVLCGSAPLSSDLQRSVQEKFNGWATVMQGWGMTEATCAATLIPKGWKNKIGTVGVLIPNMEAKLLGEDGTEVMEAGQRGEIHVRGPNVVLGYWENPEATRDTFDEEGWLRTGDVAYYDEDYYFRIVDRKKELIKVNAFQVSPAEVEAALLENDNIADAAVIGVQLTQSEAPRAYVTLKDAVKGKMTERDVQIWVEQRLSKHKWLTGGVIFVPEIPKLPSGKMHRRIVKGWAEQDQKKESANTRARI